MATAHRFFWKLSALSLAATMSAARGGPPAPVSAVVRVSASSSAPGHTPEMAFDDNLSTRWASARFHGQPEWIEIDLGKTLPIGNVDLHWQAAYAEHYQIQVSNDDRHWKTLFEVRDGQGGLQHCGGLAGQGE